jgi:hypothetical protein
MACYYKNLEQVLPKTQYLHQKQKASAVNHSPSPTIAFFLLPQSQNFKHGHSKQQH